MLEGQPYNQHISPVHRIGFVIQSYAEIGLLFSLIACNLPPEMYNPPVYGDILSRIYFSGSTISTLGYGDIHPTHWLSRFFAIYEALSGLFSDGSRHWRIHITDHYCPVKANEPSGSAVYKGFWRFWVVST